MHMRNNESHMRLHIIYNICNQIASEKICNFKEKNK